MENIQNFYIKSKVIPDMNQSTFDANANKSENVQMTQGTKTNEDSSVNVT